MRRVGTILLALASIFLILLGIFHEGSPDDLHFLFSALFFILFMMGISHYAVAMWRNPRYGHVSGILSVLASGLALVFIVAVVVDGLSSEPMAGGAVSNVLEHLTVFAGLAWAVWTASRLYRMRDAAAPGAD